MLKKTKLKVLLCVILSLIMISNGIIISSASEDGTWYDTALTITDFYNIPVVNCDDDEGLVYKFIAPETATYTIISISDYDIFGQLEDSSYNPIVWYGTTSGENGDFELVADLTKGKTYYLWTDPDGIDTANYTMQISYEMTSGDYTYDAYTNECVITLYSGSASSVTIPSALGGKTVIGLADKVFYGNTSLKSVSFPNTVKTLGNSCFRGCTSLTNITLHEGLTDIGIYVFQGCTSLTSVKIPTSIKDVNSHAFDGCISLIKAELSEGVEYISASAFRDCTALTEISFPSSLHGIGSNAFRGCTSLNKINIAEGLEILNSSVFRDCTSLTEIVFPESLLEIGSYTFRGCTALTAVTFLNPDTVFDSDDDIFYNCSGFTIYGHSGSTAQTYAETYSMAFEPISTYIPIQDFSLEERVLYLTVGDTYTLTPVFVPVNATNQSISWQVSNDNLVSVSATGVVTVKAAGEAVVAANVTEDYNGITETWVIMVDIIIEEDDNITTPEQQENALKVYEPVYEYVRQFKGDYVSVYNNGVYSLLDSQNNKHYSSNQDGFGDYSESFIATYDAEKNEITFNNLDGYAFTLVGYKWAGEFLGGKCVVVNSEGMYGLIDTGGNIIIDCSYDDIIYDTSDTVLLCSDSSWTSVTLGQDTYSLRSRSSVPELYNPVLSVTGEHIIASNGTAYGILTSDNMQITEFQYDLIRDAQNGLFVGYYGDLVDLIELDGTVTATLTAYFVGGYSENKIAVFNGTEFFYVDKNGETIINVNIEDIVSAEEFHESYAVVNIDGKGYTYIDTSGNIAVDSYWDYAARFAEGYALVMNYVNDNDGNSLRKWSIIDTEFNVLMTLDDEVYIDSTDEHSTNFSNGYIRTIDRDTGLMGFIRLDEFDFEGAVEKYTISGTVTSYGDADEAVTVILYDAYGIEIDSDTTTDGTYTLSAPEGTYTLEVSKLNHVTREYEITVDGDNVTQDMKIHLIGDINGDGAIKSSDSTLMMRHIRGTSLLTGYSYLCADINNDGAIKSSDSTLMMRHIRGTKYLW